MFRSKMLCQSLGQEFAGLLQYVQHRSNCLGHEGWFGNWCKFHKPYAIGNAIEHLFRYLQRQASFTAASTTNQREKARFC